MKGGKVLGALGTAAVVVNALLERDEDGRVTAVKVGPLRVWSRERWEKRPLVKRIRAKIRGSSEP